MSKKAISITTVVILLILVAVVAPYFIGAKVETEFREGIAQAKTEYGYPIELTDYERGWLHSHAVTRVQIEDTTFDVEHEITHGPLFVFGWARIHSALPNDISPEMAHFFDESPLVANTKLGFGGGYRIGIQSPAFDKDLPDEPGVHLTWQGLKGYYARHDNEVDLQLNGGGLKLDAENRHLVVDDIQVSGDGSAMENIEEADAKLDWDSRFEAKLGHYRMYDDAGAFDLAYGMRLHAKTANGDNDTVEFHAGYDITDLQQRLGSLGFDAGYVDGIFGSDTESAVRNFQANQGLTPDGVVGPDTVMALGRLAGRRSGEKTIAEVRETERLRSQQGLQGRRIVVGETGGVAALIDTLARRLRADGAEVLTLHQPDLSAHAKTANEWDGAVYLGVTLATEDLSVAYFQTEGFVSAGGRGLAEHASHAIVGPLNAPHPAVGMRIPILRETRMPAVWCRVGDPARVVERAPALALSLRDALARWCDRPVLRAD